MPNVEGSFVQSWLRESKRLRNAEGVFECIKEATQGESLNETELLTKLLDHARAMEETEPRVKD